MTKDLMLELFAVIGLYLVKFLLSVVGVFLLLVSVSVFIALVGDAAIYVYLAIADFFGIST